MTNLSSAKQRRQQKRSPPLPDSDDQDDTTNSQFLSAKLTSNQDGTHLQRPRQEPKITHFPTPREPSAPLKMVLSSSVRLLIVSLGNPPPYQSTRHSAGHILLRALASHLNFPPLMTRNKALGNGFLSSSESLPQYTLWQSPTLMNVSGPTVLKAWRGFTSSDPRRSSATSKSYSVHSSDSSDADLCGSVTGLIILHDELELALGSLKVKLGPTGSAKGHNGVKSVQASFQSNGVQVKHGDKLENNFVKIGVGIGRPISRERDDVSNYVLGQLTGPEKAKIEGAVPELVKILDAEVNRLQSSAGY